jgi:hypothetical protein
VAAWGQCSLVQVRQPSSVTQTLTSALAAGPVAMIPARASKKSSSV